MSTRNKQLTRTALIVGPSGQDGFCLTSLLDQKDYRVVGVERGDVDISDAKSVRDLMIDCCPDEIYLLAAYHHSPEAHFETEGELFQESSRVHTTATVHFLEAPFKYVPKSRLFFASSSHIFSDGRAQST